MGVEREVTAKVARRLVPYLFLCYIVNYLDRFNVGYAALDMKALPWFTDAAYGLGASMFFVGYTLFEVPSNLILERVGARRWMARIMVSWGAVSMAMMFVSSAGSFYGLRLLLGIMEAGFFPGMIYYLANWIPVRERARTIALFMTSTSLAGVVGGPLSGLLLRLKGVLGLAGWQWLFVAEGLPAVVLGFVTLRYLTDTPREAHWLLPAERAWLARTMEAEHRAKHRAHGLTLREALLSGRVWRLGLLYLSIIISFYGVAFWLPQIIKNFSGLSNLLVTTISAGPYLCASLAMVVVAHHSDRTGERRWHVAGPALAGAAGLALSGWWIASPWLAYLALCLAASGIWSTLGPFWSLPTAFLTGTAAAGGIALVNSLGAVGGFIGPNILGIVRQRTASFSPGLYLLAATLVAAAGIALSVRLTGPRGRRKG